MDYKKNNVSACNQMINSSELSFLGNKNAKVRILIVGNSITRHGPKEDIGWAGDWGMAASAPEKDYVHRLYAKLTGNGCDVYMRIRQASFWERNYRDDILKEYYTQDRDFEADIVIFRLGENVQEEDTPYFKEAIEKFIRFICPKRGKTIFTTNARNGPLLHPKYSTRPRKSWSPVAPNMIPASHFGMPVTAASMPSPA